LISAFRNQGNISITQTVMTDDRDVRIVSSKYVNTSTTKSK